MAWSSEPGAAVSEEIDKWKREEQETSWGRGRKEEQKMEASFWELAAASEMKAGKQVGKGRRSTSNLLHPHCSGRSGGEVAERKNEDHLTGD